MAFRVLADGLARWGRDLGAELQTAPELLHGYYEARLADPSSRVTTSSTCMLT
jgi:hypothetical protein